MRIRNLEYTQNGTFLGASRKLAFFGTGGLGAEPREIFENWHCEDTIWDSSEAVMNHKIGINLWLEKQGGAFAPIAPPGYAPETTFTKKNIKIYFFGAIIDFNFVV